MKKIIILFLSIFNFNIFIFLPSAKAEWKPLDSIGVNGTLKFTPPVYALAFSPDSKYLAVGDKVTEWWGLLAHTVGAIKILDLNTGKEFLTLKSHGTNLYSLTFSADGKYLISLAIYPDKNIKIWELNTGKELMSLQNYEMMPLQKNIDEIKRIVNNFSAIYSKNAKELYYQHPNRALDIIDNIVLNSIRPFRTVVFSPDNKYIVTPIDQYDFFYKGTKIIFQEIITGKEVIKLESPKPVTSIIFSPNGKYLATSGEDGSIKLWFDY